MIAVKIAHELGHALVAKHYGLRVSSMGVALLVLFPVLYTDNTDAWRLTNQRKKLQIVLAGLMVEFHIALLALFSWTVVEDGPLAVPPFFWRPAVWSARFWSISARLCGSMDIMHSQILGMQNLQPRAFELARWQVRQWLFGLPENPPEPFPATKHYFLVFYSFATWIYQFLPVSRHCSAGLLLCFQIIGPISLRCRNHMVYRAPHICRNETPAGSATRALLMNRQMRRTLGIMVVLFVWPLLLGACL